MVVTKLTLVCGTAPGPLELDLTGELGGNSALLLGRALLARWVSLPVSEVLEAEHTA